MIVTQFHYSSGTGWSQPLPVHLDGQNTLVLAFGSMSEESGRAPAAQLRSGFVNSVIMGCSTAGQIEGSVVSDDALTVSVVQFSETSLIRQRTVIDGAQDSFSAGCRLADQFPKRDLRAVFVLSCGLEVNGASLVAGISGGLPSTVTVSGGLAGDGDRFNRTWVLSNEGFCDRTVVAVGLYGDAVAVSHGCNGGWKDFGPERLVTRARGSELYELDGQPALALYKNYLGELAAQLPGAALRFPLSIRSKSPGARPVVRTILGVNEESQSLTFAGDVPEGSVARLMRTSVDSLVTCAEDAADVAAKTSDRSDGPVLAVSVSCIDRRLVMGERTDEEVEAVIDRLPKGSVHAGFYSYGEIAPNNGETRSAFHNQTMTVTLISEQRVALG